MNGAEHEHMKNLLQQALRPMADQPQPSRDLWPEVLQRLKGKQTMPPWYDWALLAGLACMLAVFPAAIPLLLFYL